MSQLDELIQELCPDGVPFVKMGECCTIIKGQTPIQKAIPGEYPLVVTTDERKSSNTYQFDKPSVCIPLVSSRGHGVASLNQVYYQEGKFALGNILCAVTPRNADVLSAKFLYLYLNLKKDVLIVPLMRGGANVSLSMDSLEHIKIPTPPMAVQLEVVRILGKFTELITTLTSELAARKKQYEFYRDKLLSFDTLIGREGSDIVWRPLGEIANISRGVRVVKKNLLEEGMYPVFQNCLTPMGYYNQFNRKANATFLISAGAAGEIGYSTVDFWAADDCFTFDCNKELNNRFLYHALMSKQTYIFSQVRKASIPRLPRDTVEKLEIPVPPLNIQERLVHVLDNFDAICSDLNIGLPAEIEARKKQYEFYRDKLLTFDIASATIYGQTDRQTDRQTGLIKIFQYVFGIAYVSLKDVAVNSCAGGTPLKGHSEYYAGGNIPWLRTQEVTFNEIYETSEFITEEGLKNSAAKWIPENCVIVAISGASAGRCAINKIPLTTNQHCLNIEVDSSMAMYRYIYYCVCASQDELLSKKEGARGDLNASRILSLTIPLPPLDEQKRIVSILDRFDALCNDISSGLPAEIEARRRQYEYYRDKLLQFKEKMV